MVELGDTEIDQDRSIIGGDDDILRFDVAVDDRRRVGVEIGQGVAHLARPGPVSYTHLDVYKRQVLPRAATG